MLLLIVIVSADIDLTIHKWHLTLLKIVWILWENVVVYSLICFYLTRNCSDLSSFCYCLSEVSFGNSLLLLRNILLSLYECLSCVYGVSICLDYTIFWRCFVLYDLALLSFDYYFLKYVRRRFYRVVFLVGEWVQIGIVVVLFINR